MKSVVSNWRRFDKIAMGEASVETAILSLGVQDGLGDEVTVSKMAACPSGSSFVSDVVRYTATDDRGARRSYIVKISTDPRWFEHLAHMYEAEIAAYTKILPALAVCQDRRLPKAERFTHVRYRGGHNGHDVKYVILEDMCEGGQYRTLGAQEEFDWKHLRVAVAALARFHATSFVLRRTSPDLWAEFVATLSTREPDADPKPQVQMNFKRRLMEIVDSPEAKNRLETFLSTCALNCDRYADSEVSAPHNVIAHGDCWTCNFVFRYDDGDDQPHNAVLIDWQTLKIAAPVVDLAYAVFMCGGAESASSALDLYHDVMAESVRAMGHDPQTCYPKEVFQRQLDELLPLGLVAAMVFLPVQLSTTRPDVHVEEEEWFATPFTHAYIRRFRNILNVFIANEYI